MFLQNLKPDFFIDISNIKYTLFADSKLIQNGKQKKDHLFQSVSTKNYRNKIKFKKKSQILCQIKIK